MKLFKKDKNIVALEFGRKRIKVAEAKVGKGFEVLRTGYGNIDEAIYNDGHIMNMEKLKEEVYHLLRDNGIKSEDIVIVTNNSEIITREVNIPKVEYGEIGNLLTFQMEELFPVDPSDYIIDFLILGEKEIDGAERIEVFLIGIAKSIVESHFQLLKELELNPIAMDYQGNAISKLFLKSKTLYGWDLKDKTIAAIDLGYGNIKVNIITNGKIEVTRNVDVGISEVYNNISDILSVSIEEIEEVIDDIGRNQSGLESQYDIERIENLIRTNFDIIFDKLDLLFLYYKSRNSSNNIDAITLQGGIVYNKYILDLFHEYFNVTTYVLNELDLVQSVIDLSQYGNVIGGLIRLEEV